MRAVSVWETHPIVLRQFQAASRVSDRHDLGSWDAIGIELIVPGGIERVGPIDALAVAADLDHLRAARVSAAVRVGRASGDAADTDGAGELGLSRLGDVVLTHLACSPARDVEELVVQREVDVADQRRRRAKALQQRRQLLFGRRLRQDCRCLLDMELAVLAPPRPNRAFKIGCVNDDTQKTVFADRVMRRADFERHLVIGAEIDRLHVAPRAQLPEMEMVAVFVREQVFRNDAVLELRRQPPFARHHVVARQVPPEIVMQLLRSAVDLPTAEDLERFAIHDEDARGTVCAIFAAATKRADVNPFRPTMNGMRPRVAGLFEDFLRLDDLMDLRLGGMRLCIDYINTRGADARNDQIAPLEEGVAGEGRQGRRAGVPAEMINSIALVRHHHRVNDLAVSGRPALDVDDRERIGLRRVAAEQRCIGEFLRRPFHRELWRRVKGWIRSHCHDVSFPIASSWNLAANSDWTATQSTSLITIDSTARAIPALETVQARLRKRECLVST